MWGHFILSNQIFSETIDLNTIQEIEVKSLYP